jgi:CRP/FNR family transcriptional regulator, cyclic AMP receptor protein
MDHPHLLRQIPLFESMEDADLSALGKKLSSKSFAEGDVIFAQGDEGDAMYWIEEGAVDIVAGSGAQRVTLTSLFNGQYFGELSLLDGAPRSAAAVAARQTLALALDRDDFVEFVRTRPEAALSIMHELGERMRATNELMTRTVSRNVIEEDQENLSLGDMVADKVAAFGGSWPFIFIFAGFMAVWMAWNSIAKGELAFDPLPFMFLNLFLSTIAALQAPVIMMSQNRQSTKDKAMSVNDYQVNLKNEVSIEKLLRSQGELVQRLAHVERLIAPSRSVAPEPRN